MISENRKYNFVGTLNLHRSRVLDVLCQPKDDKVNWLFLKVEEHQFSFVYTIEKPLEARYDEPFNAKLAFTMIESVKNNIQINYAYEVLRGQELIGFVNIINFLD
jgi:hypothetical protein